MTPRLVLLSALLALALPAVAADCPSSGPVIHEQFDACVDQMMAGVQQRAPDVPEVNAIIKYLDARFDKEHAQLPPGAPMTIYGQPITGGDMRRFRERFSYPMAETRERLFKVGQNPSIPPERKAELIRELNARRQALGSRVQAAVRTQTPFGGLMKDAYEAYQEWAKANAPPQPPGQAPVVPGAENWGSPAVPKLQLGAGKLSSGDDAGAREAASEALKLDPANVDALKLRAQAAALMGDNAAANRDANAALALDPGNKDLQTLAAITEGRAGPRGSAAAAQAAGFAPEGGAVEGRADWTGRSDLPRLSADQLQSAALAREARGELSLDPDKAVELAGKAIALDGKNAGAYYARGVAYERKGDHASALKDAVAGLAYAPKQAGLWALEAAALDREGRYADARAAAQAALELDPRSASAWMAQANALAGLGDKAGALKALAQAASLDAAAKPLYEQAVNAPADSDLMFLFSSPDQTSAAARAAQARPRRFGLVAGAAAAGGLLLALGLLPLLLPPLKSAFTKAARKPSAVHAGRYADTALASPAPREAGLLRGQYRILRQIGAGGMGLVYEGEDVSLGRKVAIKRMRDELKSDRRERARFVSEAKLVAALHHPNIVDIYAIVEEGDDVYLVFEYIQGQTLHELIQSKGRLTLEEALPILKGAAEGLEYAHSRGIIHRDLKPSNIMLDDEGRPRVMDFGIARMAKDATRAMTNTIVGTPPYMAPEQEQGLVRKESDVYALALCAYEMLTGRLAFAGTGAGMLMNKVNKAFAPATTLAPELPPQADELFAQALEPDPSKRVPAPGAFLQRLEAAKI